MNAQDFPQACPMTRSTPTGGATLEAWWATAGADGITWTKRWDRVISIPRWALTASGFRRNVACSIPVTTAWTGMWKSGRGEATGADLGQRDDRQGRLRTPMPELRDRTAKLAGALAPIWAIRRAATAW